MKFVKNLLLSALFFPLPTNAAPTQAWKNAMTITSFVPTDSDLIVLVNDNGDPANNRWDADLQIF